MGGEPVQKLARELHGRIKAIGGPTPRYLDELIALKCAPDLLATEAFPNAKEISESFAAYNAARKYLKKDFSLGDPDVNVIAVGDGCSPRTALTFAFRSKWIAHSVDPRLREKNKFKVKRIHLYKKKIEDFSLTCKKAIIVAVHSHAMLQDAVNSVKADKKAVIAIPCCVQQVLDIEPDECYMDWGIFSAERVVKIWKNI